ncbi:MAG: hypothetical protein ACOC0J_01000 [Myxococcota bacterium]
MNTDPTTLWALGAVVTVLLASNGIILGLLRGDTRETRANSRVTVDVCNQVKCEVAKVDAKAETTIRRVDRIEKKLYPCSLNGAAPDYEGSD